MSFTTQPRKCVNWKSKLWVSHSSARRKNLPKVTPLRWERWGLHPGPMNPKPRLSFNVIQHLVWFYLWLSGQKQCSENLLVAIISVFLAFDSENAIPQETSDKASPSLWRAFQAMHLIRCLHGAQTYFSFTNNDGNGPQRLMGVQSLVVFAKTCQFNWPFSAWTLRGLRVTVHWTVMLESCFCFCFFNLSNCGELNFEWKGMKRENETSSLKLFLKPLSEMDFHSWQVSLYQTCRVGSCTQGSSKATTPWSGCLPASLPISLSASASFLLSSGVLNAHARKAAEPSCEMHL